MTVKNPPLYEVQPITDLKDMFQYACRSFADRKAFLSKPVKGQPYVPITYRQYGEDVSALGTVLLSEFGLRRGTATAILGESQYEWYVSYLAVVNGASVVVPLDKELPAQELASLLCRSHVEALILAPAYEAKLAQALAYIRENRLEGLKLRILISMGAPLAELEKSHPDYEYHCFTDLIHRGRELLARGETAFDEYKIDPDEMRILLFTSGTTAQSKAVMHNHRALATNLMSMCKMVNIRPDDIFFSVLPLHHTYECTCGFLCPIYRGACIAQCEGLRYIPQNLAECKATVFLVVPLIAETFHKRIQRAIKKETVTRYKVNVALRLSQLLRKAGFDQRRRFFSKIIEQFGGHLRLLIIGGAKVKAGVIESLNAFGILTIQGYGLTECAPIIALNHDQNHKAESAGQALPGVEIRVADEGPDHIGEFIAKGPNIMLGYYENPEATAEVLDEEGFFHTGDLGYIDQDGFLIITGRKKNVIVTDNGKNIYPEEIEALLAENELVAESIVTGAPGPKGETQIVCEIYPNLDEVKARFGVHTKITDDEVQKALEAFVRELNQSLPSYKTIRKVLLRDKEFEKNTSKKIKRKYTKG